MAEDSQSMDDPGNPKIKICHMVRLLKKPKLDSITNGLFSVQSRQTRPGEVFFVDDPFEAPPGEYSSGCRFLARFRKNGETGELSEIAYFRIREVRPPPPEGYVPQGFE